MDDDAAPSGLAIQCRMGYAGFPQRVCTAVGNDCQAEVFCSRSKWTHGTVEDSTDAVTSGCWLSKVL